MCLDKTHKSNLVPNMICNKREVDTVQRTPDRLTVITKQNNWLTVNVYRRIEKEKKHTEYFAEVFWFKIC